MIERLDFDLDELEYGISLQESVYRISVSGAQEKFPALIKNGKIQLATSDERSTHILKPAPWDHTLRDRQQMPANEHLTMLIASRVYGIPTAEHSLCNTPSGQFVYITRRFDILPDGTKLQMEDFASVVGRNEQPNGTHFKYSGCYEDIAIGIRQNVAVWMIDMERFFKTVVFNYIYANGDAHLKNFSLIYVNGDIRLAPAYDLLNTSLHIDGDDFALDKGLSTTMEYSDVYDRTGHPCRQDFEHFGLKIGLRPKRIGNILDEFTSIPDTVKTMIGESKLTEKLRRSYLRIISERVARFNRKD